MLPSLPRKSLRPLLPSCTALLSFLFLLLTAFHTTVAAETQPDSILKADHNHHWLSDGDIVLEVPHLAAAASWDEASKDQNAILYEADFIGADSSILGRRALQDHTALVNNAPEKSNVVPGDSIFYQVERAQIFGNRSPQGEGLPSVPFVQDGNTDISPGVASDGEEAIVKRQNSGDSRTVYISVNTCLQPAPNTTTTEVIPQLTLYVTTSTSNANPGPNSQDPNQQSIPLIEGFANATVQTSSDIFIAVHAPNFTDATMGQWNFEIAASIDAPYHQSFDITDQFNRPILQFVDSDNRSALLVTTNLTSNTTSADINAKWMSSRNPFTLYAFSNASQFRGVQNSYCGLNMASKSNEVNSTNTITARGDVGLPKAQFYVQNLQRASSYTAFMVMDGNSTNDGSDVVGGGGAVWPFSTFTTKSDDNCALLFELPFCSSISYAAPSNPSFPGGLSALSQTYDNYTRDLYRNFSLSMQQIPCNTTDTARYSLVAGCDNCTAAYKDWLCAVAIPRCEDFDARAASQILLDGQPTIAGKALMPRNIGQNFPNNTAPNLEFNSTSMANFTSRTFANSSRLPMIDEKIKPGPYMEFLPCEDLCFNLVRMCPASMQFACPQGMMGQRSYGLAGSCNVPGQVFIVSGGLKLYVPWMVLVASSSVVLLFNL